MGGHASYPRVRLAELVAALSLGVDLGFGQPMEHVLRQCLIALRLADQAGLDEADRVAVYYTALLVNVGCHSDAHEQAKWFGDDIALKSGKYRHDLGSLRAVLAAMRLVGAGNPPLAPVPRGPGVRLFRTSRARRHDLPACEPGPEARRATSASRAGMRFHWSGV